MISQAHGRIHKICSGISLQRFSLNIAGPFAVPWFSMSRIVVFCIFAATFTGLGCDAQPIEPARVAGSLETTLRSRPWRQPAGVELSSNHYRIFTTANSSGVSKYLPGFMEVSRRHYLQLTGLADEPSDELMAIYLMATRQEWDALTRHAVGKSINISAGGFCFKGVCFFWDIGINSTLSVAAH